MKGALLKRAARDQGSPLHRLRQDALHVAEGRVVSSGGVGEAMADLMARHPDGRIEEEAITGRDMGRSKHGRQAFGAQSAKVLSDPDTLHAQVERLVGAFAGGRAINPMLVRSRLIGAMV